MATGKNLNRSRLGSLHSSLLCSSYRQQLFGQSGCKPATARLHISRLRACHAEENPCGALLSLRAPKKASYRQPHWALAQRAKRRTPAMWGVYHVGCLSFARGSSPRTPAWRAVRACGLAARPLRYLVSFAASTPAAFAPAPELCGLLRGRVGVRAPLSSQPPRASRAPKGGWSSPSHGRGERSRLSPRSLFLRGSRPASSQPERQRSVFDFAGRQPRRKMRLGRQLFALSSQQRASACLAILYRSA